MIKKYLTVVTLFACNKNNKNTLQEHSASLKAQQQNDDKVQTVKPAASSTRKEKEIGIRDSSVVLEDCMESLRNRVVSAKDASTNNNTSDESKRTQARKETRESLCKTPSLKSVSNMMERNRRRNSTAKRLLQRAKSYGHHNTRNLSVPATTLDDKPNSTGARKFVLPVRSAHSSRVIKPNKRFIEELEENSAADKSQDSEGQKHASKKAKVASGRQQESREESRIEEKETRSSKLKKTLLGPVKEPVQRIVSAPKRLQNIAGKRRTTTTTTSGRVQQQNLKAVSSDSIVSNGQAIVPTKTLPESSESSARSSRVQTRSETLGDSQSNAESTVDDAIDKPKDANNAKGAGKQNEAMESLDSYDNLGELSGMSESSSENSDATDDEQSEWSGTKLNGGKVILRKARLKLANNDIWDTEGPFSSSQNGNGD